MEAIVCQGCDEGVIVPAIVKVNGTRVFVCQECETTWFDASRINEDGPAASLPTYLESLGRPPLWSELIVDSE